MGRHLRIATPAQTKIGEMVKTARTRHTPEDSVIYRIPCSDDSCDEAYFGQTSRGLKKRLAEHISAFRRCDDQSAFLRHAWRTNHTPNWNGAEVLHKGIGNKKKRLFLESALIRTNKNMNAGARQAGDFVLGMIPAQATVPRRHAT